MHFDSAEADPAPEKLSHAALTDVINLTLWAGKLMLQNGSSSQRTFEVMKRFACGLGSDEVHIFISFKALMITTISGKTFRTKMAGIPSLGVNLSLVAAINHLSYEVERADYNRLQVRQKLTEISNIPVPYNNGLSIVMAGLGCASFSQLFSADIRAFFVVFVASAIAASVRLGLHARHVHIHLSVFFVSFTAALLTSLGCLLELTSTPESAIAASVLLAVPGVQLVNALLDIIMGHVMTGIGRLGFSAMVIFAIALGVVAAMDLTNAQILL